MIDQELKFQQYRYLAARRQSIYNTIRIQHIINMVQSAINTGVNPEEDPQIAPIYRWLVSEYGKSIFVLEQDENSAIEEES